MTLTVRRIWIAWALAAALLVGAIVMGQAAQNGGTGDHVRYGATFNWDGAHKPKPT